MREIKFRAFNKRTNQMVNLNEITPLALSISPELAGGGIGVYVPDHPDIIVMQYTGLKDRNGKEIYEGDVVCTSLLIPGEVKWGDDIACFEVVHSLGSRGLFGYIKEGSGVLVIGNVHENPDLLKCTTHS